MYYIRIRRTRSSSGYTILLCYHNIIFTRENNFQEQYCE